MKRSSYLALLLGVLFLLSVAGTAAAAEKTLAVPKGTKVEKTGPGDFKLTAPDGTVFTITSYKKAGKAQGTPGAAGIAGACGIHDAKGKLIATGANGIFKGGASVKNAQPTDYLKIDDEVTWLPAVIQFPSLRIFDRQALTKLSPQPDPPGKR